MTFKGRIQGNVVILEVPPGLPDGTQVLVNPISSNSVPDSDRQAIIAKYAELAGSVKGLPSDFAHNHDHYIHGTPKEQFRILRTGSFIWRY